MLLLPGTCDATRLWPSFYFQLFLPSLVEIPAQKTLLKKQGRMTLHSALSLDNVAQ